MAATRPNLSESRTTSSSTLRSLPSPRIEHFDGEIPPALSPLDAFAAQGRLLAKQLDESRRKGRRMSRLPPASVARSLSQPRSGFFRSNSSNGSDVARFPTVKASPEVEQPRFRPRSEYPRLSGFSDLTCDEHGLNSHDRLHFHPASDEFEIPRVESPEQDLSIRVDGSQPEPELSLNAPFGVVMVGPSRHSSTESGLNVSNSLAPSASLLARPSSGTKLTQTESSDDDYSSSNAGSTFSKPRKCSGSSAMSIPHSPMSPFGRSRPHSPSMSSETSTACTPLPRPSFNFSRPMSRSSTSLSAPPAMIPGEQLTTAPSSQLNRGKKPSPIIVPSLSDGALNLGDTGHPSGTSSYIYSKYSLPRGRMISRDSLVFSPLQTPHFEWQEPLFENSPPPSASRTDRSARTPSPPPSRNPVDNILAPDNVSESPATNRSLLSTETISPSSRPEAPSSPRTSKESFRTELETSRSDDIGDNTSTTGSTSTIRPKAGQAVAGSSVPSMTAEDHVSMGIECHQNGSLNESTYHLRVAAKQNHPTGMLLYALACRHGWGMRANQREGVQWLRNAVDRVGLELKEGASKPGNSRTEELLKQKSFRAQFALSVYELGVSHLNGWGVEQDKALALRCFEIAAEWGDADAMAEAGYCYAEGVGCKKDMKKAAKFYRMAEANGMNIVGNSWIYKDKYLSDDEGSRSRGRQSDSAHKKKARSKSRTRSIFQRKKPGTSEN